MTAISHVCALCRRCASLGVMEGPGHGRHGAFYCCYARWRHDDPGRPAGGCDCCCAMWSQASEWTLEAVDWKFRDMGAATLDLFDWAEKMEARSDV